MKKFVWQKNENSTGVIVGGLDIILSMWQIHANPVIRMARFLGEGA